MPKVVIQSDRPHYVVDDENEIPVKPGEVLPDNLRGSPIFQDSVHVGWSKGQDVEFGTGRFEASTGILFEGFFTTLDRDGCNRLVRAVREARDAAFGKDA